MKAVRNDVRSTKRPVLLSTKFQINARMTSMVCHKAAERK